MTTDAQINTFLRSLKLDHAITAPRVGKHYGINEKTLDDLEQAGKIYSTKRDYRVSHGFRNIVPIRFICHNARAAQRPSDTLRHLAALAEMRFQLGSPIRWRLMMLSNPQFQTVNAELPDAIWFSDGFPAAVVEFDAGSQSHAEIARKSSVYHQKSQMQIWGAPSARRAQGILQILEQNAPNPLLRWVMVVDWIGQSEADVMV